MRAWVLHRTGDPRDVLSMQTMPTPEPGPGDLLVNVEVAGVMFPDLLLVRGEYQITLPLPSTPGGELIGRVRAAGPGTSTPVGTRVMATTVPGRGSFAQQTVVCELHSEPLPEELPVVPAIALPTNYVTAHLALHRRARLAPGEVVVVFGGGGGVGSAAIDLARAAGASVVGVDLGPERAKRCEDAGADVGIDAAANDVSRVVKEFTDGRGADVVIDPVGGDLFESARRFIAFEGRIVVVGFVSGTIPSVKVNQLILRSFTVMGVNAMVTLWDHPEVHRDSRAAVVELLRQGALTPRMADVTPFERLPEALAALGERAVAGKSVIAIGADVLVDAS
jgi:NADPH2:quinone reductase